VDSFVSLRARCPRIMLGDKPERLRALLGLGPFKPANALMVKWNSRQPVVYGDSLSHGYLLARLAGRPSPGSPVPTSAYPWSPITGSLGVNPDGPTRLATVE